MNTPAPFDRLQIRAHRDRAASEIDSFNFLHRLAAETLADRLRDVTRGFDVVVEIGAAGPPLSAALRREKAVSFLMRLDPSVGLARRSAAPAAVAEEEWLPLAENSTDLLLSSLTLHSVNDLPGTLIQINRILRPDGLFLGAMLGGETLHELRRAIMETELELLGGASPRLSPVVSLRDAAGLMQRAGFALPVIDRDQFTATYDNLFRLIADLRGMGETSALRERDRRILPRAFWPAVAERYHSLFADENGRIPATFEIIYLSGWAPAPGQQRPLRPGSARARLADALGTTEHRFQG